MKPNRLVWVLLAALLAFVGLALMSAGEDTETPPPSALAAPPTPGEPMLVDPMGDTSVDTLNTIMAQVNQANDRIEELESGTDNDDAMGSLKDEISTLRAELQAMKQRKAPSGLSEPGSPIEMVVGAARSVNPLHLPDNDVPVKLDTAEPAEVVTYPVNMPVEVQTTGYVTLVPLVSKAPAPAVVHSGPSSSLNPLSDSSTPESDNTPVYTLHPGTTLFDAAAMTALIGRVPVGGQVSDPAPAKFVVGAENFAANGHSVPGIAGAIFTGSVVGDWTMSCVQVVLKQATFVFPDGRIRTVPDGVDKNGALKGIGYISDRNGNCVQGQRITDRNNRALWSFGEGLIQGFADALAAEQTTTTTSTDGNSTTSVDGDKKRYQLGKAISQGISDTRNSYEQLWGDTFDVIYAKPGTKVVLHINRPLTIDYELKGRKVSYESYVNADGLD